jgi:hypothetical protein
MSAIGLSWIILIMVAVLMCGTFVLLLWVNKLLDRRP